MKKILLVSSIFIGIWGCQKEKLAGFRTNPFQPAALMPVTFSANSSSGTTYIWDFGDNTNASGYQVKHSYYLKGNYTVELSVDGTKTYQLITVR